MNKIKFLLPLLALFVSVCAMANIASGTCGKDGNNISWVISDDGTLTLSGSGEMKNINNETNVPWYSHREKIKKAIVNEGITRLRDCAFWGCKALASVTLPNSLTSIDYQDFYQCSSLTSIVIPNSVKIIDTNAFGYCSGLTSIDFPNSVTTIGSSSFSNCSNLASVTIPSSVTKIDGGAFSGCNKLMDVSCEATDLPKITSTVFTSITLSSGTLCVPAEALDKYKSDTNWGKWNNIVSSGPAIIASGTCGKNGDNVKWCLTEDGILSLNGKGEMADYYNSHAPWYDNRNSIIGLSISEGITNISN